MQNELRDNELQLSRFAEYLLANRLVPQAHARFYVLWVRRFLEKAAPDPALSLLERIECHLQALKAGQLHADWQIEQAERALRLYFHNFLKNTDWENPQQPSVSPGPDGAIQPVPVRDETRRILRLRHYAYRTEQTYLEWIERFFAFLRQTGSVAEHDSIRISEDGLKSFLAHLALRRQVSASTQNQALNAILFLFKEVLRLPVGDLSQGIRARRGERLPTVLSRDEVIRLFDRLSGTALLRAQLIYGGGLRVMECCRLRVKDIDFDQRFLIIREGKGNKDRTTLLPEAVIPFLREHLTRVRRLHDEDLKAGVGAVYLPDALAVKYPNAPLEWGWQWVFPSKTLSTDPRAGVVRRHHVSDRVIQSAIHDAARAADLAKPVSVHTLRHSFATHLLLDGVDIRQIQDYLGHVNVETTMIYTHVVRDMRRPAKSPLDGLNRA